jgi:hypothetical protein
MRLRQAEPATTLPKIAVDPRNIPRVVERFELTRLFLRPSSIPSPHMLRHVRLAPRWQY